MASNARIDELQKKFNENPRRYFAPLANEFRKAGEIDQAIMICEEYLPQQPGHMSGHIVYGQALYESGRLPESRTVFETALALDPENLIALRHLGDIAHGQGDDESARVWYMRVLDADPRNEEIQGLIAQLGGSTAPSIVEDAPAENAFAGLMDEPALSAPRMTEPELVSSPTPPPVPEEVEHFDPVPVSYAPTVEIEPITVDVTPSAPPPLVLADPSLVDTQPVPAIPSEEPDFIPGEFTPPAAIDNLADLETTSAADARDLSLHFEPLEGLEGVGGASYSENASAPERDERDQQPVPPPLPDLDIDEGDTTPAHGDVLDPDAATAYPEPPSNEHELPMDEFMPLDFAPPAEQTNTFDTMPTPVVSPAIVAGNFEAPTAAFDARDEEHFAAREENVGADEIPLELPPEVIAAEAELITAGVELEEHESAAPGAGAPFVTETMAELYMAQGFRDEARSVYEQLLSASPSDTRLQAIVQSLQAPADVAIDDSGPLVRDFLSRLAARRPGERAASYEAPADDDFAAADAALDQGDDVLHAAGTVVEEYQPTAEADAQRTDEEATDPDASGGSIDALFGNRAPTRTEDSAAAALAQAFGGGAEEPAAPVLTGRPARAATGELTLDSVFRDAPARAQRVSQHFSFDQFFAGSSTAGQNTPRSSQEVPLPETPTGERGAEDIEQFNSWLQGLKPR